MRGAWSGMAAAVFGVVAGCGVDGSDSGAVDSGHGWSFDRGEVTCEQVECTGAVSIEEVSTEDYALQVCEWRQRCAVRGAGTVTATWQRREGGCFELIEVRRDGCAGE